MEALAWIDASFSLRLARTLAHFLWQGCAVACIAVVAGWVLKRGSAQWRYAAYVAAMLLMAACLPVTFALVSVPAPAPGIVVVGGPFVAAPVTGPVEIGSRSGIETTDVPVAPPDAGENVVVPEANAVGNSSHEAGTATTSELQADAGRVQVWWEPVAPYVVGVYLAGAAIMLLRLASGLWGSHKLRRAAIPVTERNLLATIERQSSRIGLRSAPVVAWCEQISIPIVIGIRKPMVLVPSALASGLSLDQLHALLMHELAHIRRFDLLLNLLQRLIEAVLFFHPAVWLVSRRVSVERENAADDVVLAAGWQPIAYADALVRMAELSSVLREPRVVPQGAAVAAHGGRVSDFKRRVLRILNGGEPTRLWLSRGGLLVILLIFVTLLFAPAVVQSWSDNDLVEASDPPMRGVDTQDRPQVEPEFERTTEPAGKVRSGEQKPRASVVSPEREAFLKRNRARKPDGVIRWVGDKTQVVWINLGPDDGLKKRTVFSVLSTDDYAAGRSGRGSIEVSRFIGPHLSEARVLVQVHHSRPIAKDDFVISPVWSPGGEFHVALVGAIDMDGEGKSDRDRLRKLVDESGGLIVDEVDDAANRAGKGMDVHTKFLVVGRIPNPAALNDRKQKRAAAKVVEQHRGMLTQARELGIRVITVRDFMAFLEKRPKRESAAGRESERLQGLWQVTSATLNGVSHRGEIGTQLFFVDDFLCSTMHSRVFQPVDALERTSFRLSKYRVDPLKNPKQFDFVWRNDGIDRVAQPCVYSLERDVLTIAATYRTADRRPRPKNLVSRIGNGNWVVQLKRVDPAELQPPGREQRLRAAAALKALQAEQVIHYEPAWLVYVHHPEYPTPISFLASKWMEREFTRPSGVYVRGRVKDVAAVLRQLEVLAGLQKLRLMNSRVVDAHLQQLATLKTARGLKEMHLTSAGITDAGLGHLSGLTNLTELRLDYTEIGDAGMVHLKNLTRLEELQLGYTNITDAGLIHLWKMKNLQTLNLIGDNITDAGMEHLQTLDELRTLSLCRTNVTDAGLDRLKPLKRLKSLDLSGTDVTDAGIDALQQALPSARIKRP